MLFIRKLLIIRLLLPLTDLARLSAACLPPTIPQSLAGPRRYRPPLSPFHLAIDWENWDSLGVLASRLDSSQFRLPVEECRAHGDYCLLYREDLGEESDDDEEEVKAKEEEEKVEQVETNEDEKASAPEAAEKTEAEKEEKEDAVACKLPRERRYRY